MMRQRVPFLVPLASLALAAGLGGAACQGRVDAEAEDDEPGDDPSDEGGGGSSGRGGRGGGSGSGGAGGGDFDPNAAGPLPVRRLNRREYNNTVRDLLGDTTRPADAFPADTDETFLFHRAGVVALQDATTLRTAAEALAGAAVKNLATLLPCDPAKTGEPACARQFVETFGLRAYRRPLSSNEVNRSLELYNNARTKLAFSFGDAIGVVVEGMLQAPAFLYHWEVGETGASKDGALVRLGPYEVASRLSYFVWGSMPDRDLFAAAAGNKLSTDADIEAQALRMLKDQRARDAMGAFFEDWLDLDKLEDKTKDQTVYPEYTDALRAAMREELQAFAKDVVFVGDGRLETLFGAHHSFVNQALAGVYGNLSQVRGTALERVELNPKERQGFLTQPGFLALTGATNGSSPVKRGHVIFERVLCGDMPPPPANVPPPKPASAGGTTRERFAEHAAEACARACHEIIDPLGFPFENFDGIGKLRTMDAGKPVDTRTDVTLDGKTKPVANALELSTAIGASAEARGCFAKQWVRFALNRSLDDADAGSLDAAVRTFESPEASVQDLVSAVAKSRSFRFRSPSAGEVLR